MSLLVGQEMNILRYSLVCKSALINPLNKSSHLTWRIAQFMLDRIKETAIHWFHLGIFFPTLISQSWSPEEAVRTSKFPCSSVTYTHFLTSHWKALQLFMCSVRADVRFHFKWTRHWLQQPADTQVTHGSWVMGLLRKCHRGAGYCSRMAVQLGTGHWEPWSCCNGKKLTLKLLHLVSQEAKNLIV